MSSRRELWFTAPGAVELRSAPERALAAGQVRARALASGISQGTELLLYRGEGPTPFDPSLDTPGAPTYPRRYGYAWVGEVEESRDDALAPGTRVFGLLPHAEQHCAEGAAFRPISEGLPAPRAALAANLETAVTVLWDGAVGLGDEVLVIGGGVVGLLCGYAARLSGASRVRLIEPSSRRRQAAFALGFDEVFAPEHAPPTTGSDVVIEASGRPECLSTAIAHARQEGVVVVASLYGARVAPVSLGSEFHRRRLSLRASQVSHIPPARGARWSVARRFELVAGLLADPRLDALLERSQPFADASALYARLDRAPGDALQCVFDYTR